MAFGKSKSFKDLPNSSNILSAVSDMEIYEMYLGKIPRKAISSPLRDDTNPSFSLFHSQQYNKIFWRDFATGESGDCFLFVMRLFNFRSKIEVFNRIASDFNLTQFELNPAYSTTSPIKRHVKKSSKKKSVTFIKKYTIRVTVRPWKIRDKLYWEKKYGLNKAQLEYCKIFPISHFFINGFCTKADELAYAFVEEKDGVQTFKIYQPFSKESKWINNNDFSTWELWTQMPAKGDILIITSSRKDAAVIKSLFPSKEITSVALQSENVNAKESVVNELKERFNEIFVLYDNDFKSDKNQGRIAGEKLCDATGFLQIEIPDGCGVKDPSDYIDEFDGVSLKRLIQGLISKRLREEELKQIM